MGKNDQMPPIEKVKGHMALYSLWLRSKWFIRTQFCEIASFMCLIYRVEHRNVGSIYRLYTDQAIRQYWKPLALLSAVKGSHAKQ